MIHNTEKREILPVGIQEKRERQKQVGSNRNKEPLKERLGLRTKTKINFKKKFHIWF